MKKFWLSVTGIVFGFGLTFLVVNNFSRNTLAEKILSPLGIRNNVVLGFLPYWLVGRADKNYWPYISTLSYFSLTIGPDGKIARLAKPGEEDPGWYALKSKAVDNFLNQAKNRQLPLSLTVFSGDQDTIDQLLKNPLLHGQALIDDVAPLMKDKKFTDLNLDIESVIPASDSARENFSLFVKTVKKGLLEKGLGTLTVDVAPDALIKKELIDVKKISNDVDYLVLMTYDFHFLGSYVTGPVGQNRGGGVEAEYDSETAVKEVLRSVPSEKIILGVPLYGYEWETLGDSPRSAVIPESGLIASARRVEGLIGSCSSCSAKFDNVGEEPYLIYKNEDTGTFTQIFYPDAQSVEAKIKLANQYRLGGVALWALGYEGAKTLDPLKAYNFAAP